VSVYCSTCVCVSVCVKNQIFWCREALTPNFRCEQGKTAVPDDASNWKMLMVQDGSAHSARALSSTPTATGRAHLAHPRHGSPTLFMLVGDSAARSAARVLLGSWAITAKVKATSFGTKIDPV
jgi:hypothetical protein